MTAPASANDKARGLLLGAALGDALGAPFEGHDTVDGARLLLHERSTEQPVGWLSRLENADQICDLANSLTGRVLQHPQKPSSR